MDDDLESKEMPKENANVSDGGNPAVQTVDTKDEMGENVDKSSNAAAAAPSSSVGPSEGKSEDYPGWPLSEMDRMAFDPLHLAQLNKRLDEDEEDYDEEE